MNRDKNSLPSQGSPPAPIGEPYGPGLYDLTAQFLRNASCYVTNPNSNIEINEQGQAFVDNMLSLCAEWDSPFRNAQTPVKLMDVAEGLSIALIQNNNLSMAEICVPSELKNGMVADVIEHQEGRGHFSSICRELSILPIIH